jgi:hypothetical protein
MFSKERVCVLLGAKSDLLGTVGSWGDTLPDENVLAALKSWNNEALSEVKGRIEQFEISCRPVEYIPPGRVQSVHREPQTR